MKCDQKATVEGHVLPGTQNGLSLTVLCGFSCVCFWHGFPECLMYLIKLKPLIDIIYKTIQASPSHLAKWLFVFLTENSNLTRSVVYKHRFYI